MCLHTSVCMFGTEPVLPFAMAELELLGLLGPEPGALLQSDDTGRDEQQRRHMGRRREAGSRFLADIPVCFSKCACVCVRVLT